MQSLDLLFSGEKILETVISQTSETSESVQELSSHVTIEKKILEMVTSQKMRLSSTLNQLESLLTTSSKINFSLKHYIVEKIESIVKDIFKDTYLNIRYDYTYNGPYITVTVKMKASEAIEKWNVLVDRLKELKIHIPVFVNWLDKTNLTPEELGYQIGVILAKMDIGLVTEQSIDVSEIIRVLRE